MKTLGQTAKDTITGFEGVITARAEYITGCTQMLLQPALDKDGKFTEARWFDEDRITVTKEAEVKLPRTKDGFDSPAPIR